MAKLKFDNLPQGNPCAQCGKSISTPEWIESGPRRVSYLWHCWACDYQFEAVAFFEQEVRAARRIRNFRARYSEFRVRYELDTDACRIFRMCCFCPFTMMPSRHQKVTAPVTAFR